MKRHVDKERCGRTEKQKGMGIRMKTAYLLLEDGTAYKGYAMGAERDLSAGGNIKEMMASNNSLMPILHIADPCKTG